MSSLLLSNNVESPQPRFIYQQQRQQQQSYFFSPAIAAGCVAQRLLNTLKFEELESGGINKCDVINLTGIRCNGRRRKLTLPLFTTPAYHYRRNTLVTYEVSISI